ncbi:MAG TPA: porin [Paraburkholderia sp.]|uniref:porin n=1 Tax=Paraburkholderia sp. TaxID=1926495 RepID=UPI002B48E6F0|nr:porin [Paraburkholderia sp.]HKR44662.1 porin [Paraburkholderia sp.]
MKNTLIIAGVLSAFAVSAHAQSSVTLYGSLDAGIVYANNAGGHAAWNQGSGALSDTYFGLKGSEDLGGGLHAIFTLENGFNLNNGKNTENNTMFNRQAFVGLQSDRFGTVTLGRQYDSMVDYLSPLSEAGSGYGNNMAAHPFDNDNLDHSFSIKNSVKYQSANYAGFKFGGLYGFSNDAGQFSNNRAWSVGASYNRGPLNAAASYMQINNSIGQNNNKQNGAVNAGNGNNFNLTAQTQRTMGAGVNYAYGPATVGFVWTHTQYENLLAGSDNAGSNFVVPTGTNLHLDNFELNGSYALTPALALNASYTFTNGKLKSSTGSTDPKWHTVSLQADYSLSKRTDVYVEGVYQHASGSFGEGRENVAMINTLSPSTSQNQIAATVGMRHRF